MWMNDRAGLAASQDYGRDEEAAVKLLKKHMVLSCQVPSRAFWLSLCTMYLLAVSTRGSERILRECGGARSSGQGPHCQ